MDTKIEINVTSTKESIHCKHFLHSSYIQYIQSSSILPRCIYFIQVFFICTCRWTNDSCLPSHQRSSPTPLHYNNRLNRTKLTIQRLLRQHYMGHLYSIRTIAMLHNTDTLAQSEKEIGKQRVCYVISHIGTSINCF